MIELLVLFSKLFDGLVDEFSECLRLVISCFATLVQKFEELTQVLLAVLISVGLINQAESTDEDFNALTNSSVL